MRRAAKRDGNAAEIIDCLRRFGCQVHDLGSTGDGVPDILVYRPQTGLLRLIEVKSKKGRLTEAQVDWHRRFPVWIVRTPREALLALGFAVVTEGETP